jgi:hypothetical protein
MSSLASTTLLASTDKSFSPPVVKVKPLAQASTLSTWNASWALPTTKAIEGRAWFEL